MKDSEACNPSAVLFVAIFCSIASPGRKVGWGYKRGTNGST